MLTDYSSGNQCGLVLKTKDHGLINSSPKIYAQVKKYASKTAKTTQCPSHYKCWHNFSTSKLSDYDTACYSTAAFQNIKL